MAEHSSALPSLAAESVTAATAGRPDELHFASPSRQTKLRDLVRHCQLGDCRSLSRLLKSSRTCRKFVSGDICPDVLSPQSDIDNSSDTTFSLTAPLLHLAVKCGQPQLLRLLLKHRCPVSAADRPLGRTALHLAAGFADPDTCSTLIDHGANLSRCDLNNRTPLHLLAIGAASATSAARVLSTARVLIGQPDFNPESKDSVYIVDLVDEFGWTALHLAVIGSLCDLASCLLNEFNARTDLQDYRGRTPLHWASVASPDTASVSLIQLLLRDSTNSTKAILAKDSVSGATPLHLAAAANRVAALRQLVAGLTVSLDTVVDDRGLTPFHWAVARQANDAIEAWLTEGWPLPQDAALCAAACNNATVLNRIESLTCPRYCCLPEGLLKTDSSGYGVWHYAAAAKATVLLCAMINSDKHCLLNACINHGQDSKYSRGKESQKLYYYGNKSDNIRENESENLLGNGSENLLGNGSEYLLGNGSENLLGNGSEYLLGNGSENLLGNGSENLLGNGSENLLGNGSENLLGNGSENLLGNGSENILGNGSENLLGIESENFHVNGSENLLGIESEKHLGNESEYLHGNVHGNESKYIHRIKSKNCRGTELASDHALELENSDELSKNLRGKESEKDHTNELDNRHDNLFIRQQSNQSKGIDSLEFQSTIERRRRADDKSVNELNGLHGNQSENSQTAPMTPAHVAAAAGAVDCLAWTLASRPDWLAEPDRQRGWTPLHWAAAFGRASCASLLLDLGTPHTVFSVGAFADGWTPLDCAVFAEHLRLADWLRSRGAVTGSELRHCAASRLQRWWRQRQTRSCGK